MSLTKQDLDHIRKIVNESEVRLEKKMDIKIESANKRQTNLLVDAISGIVDSVYGNHPTRGEVKKGLKAFIESVTLKTS